MAEPVAVEEQAETQPAGEAPEAEGAAEVHEAQLPEAQPNDVRGGGGQIDILLDTAVEVSVRLGQVSIPARDLVQMSTGSVFALDKQVGEPVELLMRGIVFATGRLVVVGDQLGVKVEEILPAGARGR
jgi:flagellar motor switch protein FliN/FliY